MKKLLSFLAALGMLSAAVSCSKGGSSQPAADSVIGDISGTSDEHTADIQTLYKETVIPFEGNVDTPVKLEMCGEECYYFYIDSERKLRLAVIDSGLNVTSDAVIADYFGVDFGICVNPDGTFYMIAPRTDFPFEYDDYNSCTNFGDFQKSGDLSFELMLMDRDGGVISRTEIIGLNREYDPYSSTIQGMCMDAAGRLIFSMGDCLASVTTEGDLITTEHYSYMCIEIGSGTDGSVFAASSANFGILDCDTLKMPEDVMKGEERLEVEGAPTAGWGDFTAFLEFRDGIYAIDENHDRIMIMDYAGSIVSSSDVWIFTGAGDGRFIAAGAGDLFLYERRADDYSENRKEISIWQIEGGGSGREAADFSKSQDEYLAVMRPDLVNRDDLSKALLTDSGPDVIMYSSRSNMEDLLNLGALADLNTLIEQYGGIDKNELMPNVLQAFDMNGSLYALPEYFDVKCLIANANFVGKDMKNWSFDDLYKIVENTPEGTELFAGGNSHLMDTMILNNMAPWIDLENNVSRFNTPEFVKLLKFCREYNTPQTDGRVHETPEEQLYATKQRLSAFKEKRAVFSTDYNMYSLDHMPDIYGMMDLGWDDVSLVNMPDGGGIGTMNAMNMISVIENSKCKDGALAFIAFMLEEKRQCSLASTAGFNMVNKKAFDISVDKNISKDGEPMIRKWGWSFDKLELYGEYDESVTEEQAQEYRDFVLNCTRLSYENSSIQSIIYEEYSRFEAGEITAEECAEFIANRADIMLSEKS